MTGTAAIFGCGPSGLLAAYACDLAGVKVQIFSRKQKSKLYGAQFIGESPGDLDLPHRQVNIEWTGTIEDYRTKVYGTEYKGPDVPLSDREGWQNAYDIRVMYDLLWDLFQDQIIDWQFSPDSFERTTKTMTSEFDFVFSSLPLRQMCRGVDCEFSFQQIYAIGDAPDLDVRCPVRIERDTVAYDATDSRSWYRAANIFDHCTVEWACRDGKRKPPFENVARVMKPIEAKCLCFPNVIRIGRYGEWRKGILSIDAFNKASKVLSKGEQGVLW